MLGSSSSITSLDREVSRAGSAARADGAEKPAMKGTTLARAPGRQRQAVKAREVIQKVRRVRTTTELENIETLTIDQDGFRESCVENTAKLCRIETTDHTIDVTRDQPSPALVVDISLRKPSQSDGFGRR